MQRLSATGLKSREAEAVGEIVIFNAKNEAGKNRIIELIIH